MDVGELISTLELLPSALVVNFLTDLGVVEISPASLHDWATRCNRYAALSGVDPGPILVMLPPGLRGPEGQVPQQVPKRSHG